MAIDWRWAKDGYGVSPVKEGAGECRAGFGFKACELEKLRCLAASGMWGEESLAPVKVLFNDLIWESLRIRSSSALVPSTARLLKLNSLLLEGPTRGELPESTDCAPLLEVLSKDIFLMVSATRGLITGLFGTVLHRRAVLGLLLGEASVSSERSALLAVLFILGETGLDIINL